MNRENMLNYSLNGLEMKILNPDAKIMKYPELNEIFDLQDLFKDTDKIILLYLLNNGYSGHWICLFKNKDGYNIFDSYGAIPDLELMTLNKLKRFQLNEEKNRLQTLFKKYSNNYNNIIYQGETTETCGCFVTHRLHNSHLNEIEYFDLYKGVKNPDMAAAIYCLDILNNQ